MDPLDIPSCSAVCLPRLAKVFQDRTKQSVMDDRRPRILLVGYGDW